MKKFLIELKNQYSSFQDNGQGRRIWVGVLLALVGSTTLVYQACSPSNHSISNASIPYPAHGLKSPLPANKVQLSPKFLASLKNSKRNGSQQAKSQDDGGGQTIPVGSNLSFILNDTCLIGRYNANMAGQGLNIAYFIDSYVPPSYYTQTIGTFNETALDISLTTAIPVSSLLQIAQVDPCIVAITNAQQYIVNGSGGINYNDPDYPQQSAYLNQVNFPAADAYFQAAIPSTTKVNVAIIDTGFDLNNEDIGPLNAIMTGSNLVDGNNIPQDTDGHGTGVASLITAQGNNGKGLVGMAWRNTNLLPVRLFAQSVTPKQPSISGSQIFNAIKYAVNAGAEVINLSFSTDDADGGGDPVSACNVMMGYGMYRAILGGAFLTIAGGQWTQIVMQNNQPVPIPGSVTAPHENGPLPTGLNAGPACWGRYFKGAIAVGALQTGTQNMASISNWGNPAFELAAPGTNITTYGLENQIVQMNGTSASAAEVAAAAALVIAFHKQQGWPYTPWLIEDIIMNGSTVVPSLNSPNGVNDGKVLDLNALTAHLTQLQGETEAQRLQEPSEDPESGLIVEAGNGGPGQGTLIALQLYTDTPLVESSGANRVQMQLLAYYSNASFEVITSSQGVSYSVSNSGLGSVDASGIFVPTAGQLGSENITATFGGLTASTLVTLVNFNPLTGESTSITGLNFVTNIAYGPAPLPFFTSSQLVNMCPVPITWASFGSPQFLEANSPNSNGDGYYIGSPQGSIFDDGNVPIDVQYEDGSVRYVNYFASYFATNPDGTSNQDSFGGSSTLYTALYRGTSASLTIQHGKLPGVSAQWEGPNNFQVVRGHTFPVTDFNITTQGTCNGVYVTPNHQIELVPITNPYFQDFAFDLESCSSPQAALNNFLQGSCNWNTLEQISVGNQLPAGNYSMTASVKYSGGGSTQTFTTAPVNFTLVENGPVSIQAIAGNTNTLDGSSGTVAPASSQNWNNTVGANMVLADGTLANTAPYNYTWTVTGPNGTVSQGSSNVNATVWVDPATMFGSTATNDETNFWIFSGAVGDKYQIQVKETTTGFTASTSFQVLAPIVKTYTGPYLNNTTPNATTPLPTPPPATSTYCNENNTGLSPFAGGSGTQSDPYTICSTSQFFNVGSVQTNYGTMIYYALKSDLDFSSLGNLSNHEISPVSLITLDGQFHKLSNWTAIDSENESVGVFSSLPSGGSIPNTFTNIVIYNAELAGVNAGFFLGTGEGFQANFSNIYVVGGSFTGSSSVGSIFGSSLVGILNFTNIYANNISINSSGITDPIGGVGGLVGECGRTCSIISSAANAIINNISVPGSMMQVGGLVGQIDGPVASSWSQGSIRGATSSVGGLVGETEGDVVHCSSNVDVGAQGSDVGGLIGKISGFSGNAVSAPINVYASVASGHVWGGQDNSGGSSVGGLIGQMDGALIINSSSSGAVAGVSQVGGFVGAMQEFSQIYNSTSTGTASSSSGTAGAFIGQTGQTDYHNLQSWYTSDTWLKSANPNLSAIGNNFGQGPYTPTGITGK